MESLASLCQQHSGEEVRFYCEGCKDLVCDECITGPHKNHKFVRLKEHGVRKRKDLIQRVSSVEEGKIPSIESAVAKAKENQKIFENLIEEQIKAIRNRREKTVEILDQVQEDLIENFKSEGAVANSEFERFTKRQQKRMVDLKGLIDTVKENGSDISDVDVAKYHVSLEKLLTHDPYADTIPNLQPPIYQFNSSAASKSSLQNILGYMESGAYSLADPDILKKNEDENHEEKAISTLDAVLDEVSLSASEQEVIIEDNYVDNVMWKRKDFSELRSLNTNTEIKFVVIQEKQLAVWLVGKNITDVDFSGHEPTSKMLKQLDQEPIAAGGKSTNTLVIGLQNKKSLKQLQYTTSVVTRRSTYSLGSVGIPFGDYTLVCIGQMQNYVDDVLLCLQEKSKDSNDRYVIKWHSAGTSIQRELSLVPEKVDVSKPVQISQCKNGLMCLLCRPEAESWIVVIDQNGNQKFRYPPFNKKLSTFPGQAGTYDIVGAGFIGDNFLTVTSRAKREQHLVDMNGQCVQTDSILNNPVCCTTDFNEYVWVGFDEGLISLFQYKEDHVYSNVSTEL